MTEKLKAGELCPTCRRVVRDWSKDGKVVDDDGRKIDSEDLPDKRLDRLVDYRALRRKMGLGVVNDFDQVEWRRDASGELVPVALLEMTRIDGPGYLPPTYFEQIIKRYHERDLQAQLACKSAELLGVKAWIVAFRKDLTEFWIYNLTDSRGWGNGDGDWYRKDFLEKLGQ